MTNEDRSVFVSLQRRVIDYVERREELVSKDIASELIVIRKSSHTFGKIITKEFGSGCAANLP